MCVFFINISGLLIKIPDLADGCSFNNLQIKWLMNSNIYNCLLIF